MTTEQGPKAPFDPWNSTFEEAWKASDEAALGEGPNAPIYQWLAAKTITGMKPATAHSGYAVLACVRQCANHDLVMPLWLAQEFIRRYDSVAQARTKSWDDEIAFGRPYPKGAQIKAIRANRLLQFKVLSEAKKMVDEDHNRPVDKGFYDELAERLTDAGDEIGASHAEELLKLAERLTSMTILEVRQQHRERVERAKPKLSKIPRKAKK